MTTKPSKELGKYENLGRRSMENIEYVRLVTTDEPTAIEVEMLQFQAQSRFKSFWWWMKVFLLCFVLIILILDLLKWGVPFAVEKMTFCGGKLIRTLRNAQHNKQRLTPVEIVYNIISFTVTIVITSAFTVYAKRTLNIIKKAENSEEAEAEAASASENASFLMEKLSLERPEQPYFSSIFQ